MRSQPLSFALLTIAFSARAAAADPGDARGTISGVVNYDGPAPVAQKLPVDVNPELCGAKTPILGEDLIVGPDSGLANVALVLAGITERKPAPKSVRLEQQNCVFSPHVQTVTAGSELIISNQDPVIHNVHARLEGQTVFNQGMPLKGVDVKKRLSSPGVTSLQCDSGHTWMLAYLVVVPHSYHATSGTKGEFSINQVLPGTYTLRSWHEKLGVRDTPVTVKAGEVSRVSIHYPKSDSTAPSLAFSMAPPPSAAGSSPEPSGESLGMTSDEREELAFTARNAQRAADVAAGRGLYLRYCASCHGDAGNGRGEAAPSLRSRPRDFTRGEFKLRSSKSGDLPLEADLVRTIGNGIPGTDMPSWRRILSLDERRTLARYAMSFSPRFLSAAPSDAIPIPKEPKNDAASQARGRELYQKLQCGQCHGDNGDAQGASKKMVDDWGAPILAADLTQLRHKSGPLPADLYRTLATGMSGTPMPSFADLIGPDEIWDLVHHIQSLATPSPLNTLLGLP